MMTRTLDWTGLDWVPGLGWFPADFCWLVNDAHGTELRPSTGFPTKISRKPA